MRLRLSRHLPRLAASLVLLGTTGSVIGTTSVPLAANIACGCGGGSSKNVTIVKPTTPFDFGKVKVGATASQVFEVENVVEVTYETIKLKKLVSESMSLGTKKLPNPCSGTLAAKSKCEIEVVFEPKKTVFISYFLEIPFETTGKVKEETDGTIDGEGI